MYGFPKRKKQQYESNSYEGMVSMIKNISYAKIPLERVIMSEQFERSSYKQSRKKHRGLDRRSPSNIKSSIKIFTPINKFLVTVV